MRAIIALLFFFVIAISKFIQGMVLAAKGQLLFLDRVLVFLMPNAVFSIIIGAVISVCFEKAEGDDRSLVTILTVFGMLMFLTCVVL